MEMLSTNEAVLRWFYRRLGDSRATALLAHGVGTRRTLGFAGMGKVEAPKVPRKGESTAELGRFRHWRATPGREKQRIG